MSAPTPLEALALCVEAYLGQLGLRYTMCEDGWVRLLFGEPEEAVVVWLLPMEREGATVVQVTSVVSRGVRTGPELGVFLADENSIMLFGKLVVRDEKSEVRFEQPLLGNFLNRAGLDLAIRITCGSAEKYRDIMKERFGGRSPRAMDDERSP